VQTLHRALKENRRENGACSSRILVRTRQPPMAEHGKVSQLILAELEKINRANDGIQNAAMTDCQESTKERTKVAFKTI
jgi:hypothetical protein